MRNNLNSELRFFLKVFSLFMIAILGERYFPRDAYHRLLIFSIFFMIAFAFFHRENKIPVNMTLVFKDKRPPDDKDDSNNSHTKNLVFEV